MESDVTHPALYYKLWGWFETHKKQVLWGAIASLVFGLTVAFFIWRHGQKQVEANEALSKVVSRGPGTTTPTESPEALVKVANEHANTSAGGRALLIAGGKFFADGKYADAKTQFDRYMREYPGTPFTAQALFGTAVASEMLGKIDEAVTLYKQVGERHPTENVAPQAQFALARLYEAQGNLQAAYDYYGQIQRSGFGTLSLQATERREKLLAKNPQLAPPAPAPAPAQPALIQPAPIQPAPARPVISPGTNISVPTSAPVLKFN